VVEPGFHPDQDYYASPAAPVTSIPLTAGVPARPLGHRSVLLAVLLSLLPGVLMLFGCGHFYAGRWRAGLAYLFGYWAATIPLMMYAPPGMYGLAWLGFLIWTPISAARAVRGRHAAI
jgi:hypothetical protein